MGCIKPCKSYYNIPLLALFSGPSITESEVVLLIKQGKECYLIIIAVNNNYNNNNNNNNNNINFNKYLPTAYHTHFTSQVMTCFCKLPMNIFFSY